MNVSTSIRGGTAVVRPQGRFDFSGHRDFRDAFKSAIQDAAVREVEIDLGGVDYVDSSALGVLLLSLENAKSAGKAMALSGARGAVRQVLEIANFQKLFVFR